MGLNLSDCECIIYFQIVQNVIHSCFTAFSAQKGVNHCLCHWKTNQVSKHLKGHHYHQKKHPISFPRATDFHSCAPFLCPQVSLAAMVQYFPSAHTHINAHDASHMSYQLRLGETKLKQPLMPLSPNSFFPKQPFIKEKKILFKASERPTHATSHSMPTLGTVKAKHFVWQLLQKISSKCSQAVFLWPMIWSCFPQLKTCHRQYFSVTLFLFSLGLSH